ncbi:substrate-binding domain-containing protein [Pseudonocardia xinjiangensis]|uniref:substrate-binding domain-containing protein n=1 Tax=Pseudonocardia xinjiangensis TaxID=75289 RepID=UPI003D945AA5
MVTVTVLVVVGAGVVIGMRTFTLCRPATVTIAADPVVAESVRQALAGERSGAAQCADIRVVDAPATQADEIRENAPGLPAIWIPDSSLALDTLDTASGSVVDQRSSLASSPVVLVLPEADAGRYGNPTRPVSWNTLLTHPRPPALPDPATDRSGLAALTALHTAIGDERGSPRPAFVAAVLSLSRGAPPSAAAGYDAMARDGATARGFLATEQSVVRHDRARLAGGSGAPVTPVALREAAAALDFPFVRVRAGQPAGRDPALDAAVDAIEVQLRGPAGRQAFGAAGLRSPDGTRLPGDPGPRSGSLPAQVTAAAPQPRPLARETLRLWGSLTERSQVLTVIDVSESMAEPAGKGTRITLAAAAVQSGLKLFPDVASVGLWAFPSRPQPRTQWQEIVPLGPLSEPVPDAPSRRDALASAAGTLPDRVGGAGTLYATTLAATRAVRAGYDPGHSNAVLLVTDGHDESGAGADLPATLQALQTEAAPAEPVPVIAIGLGPDADDEALRQIAEATGGRAYEAENPQDIRAVLLEAIFQRGCRPAC